MKHSIRANTPATATQPTPFAWLKAHSKNIMGKKVVLVVGDAKHDADVDHFATVAEMCLPSRTLTSISWPDFLKSLPTIMADAIFICSMLNVNGDSETLRSGLVEFRRQNPKAVVAMADASLNNTLADSLHHKKLIDHVEQNVVFSLDFLQAGMDILLRRQELM
jgi:hypothetical protein